VRLEVPAATVGLEGRVLHGMSFTLYDGRATWDRAGKVAGLPPANKPPVAAIAITPATAAVGTTFSLSGAGSTDPDGTIASYAWTFGDGTGAAGVGVVKSYGALGTYPVTLTVTDHAGLASATTRMVTVTATGAASPPAGRGATGVSCRRGQIAVTAEGNLHRCR
jgi:PKD repeat protein